MRYLYLLLCLVLAAPCFAVTDTLEGQELTTSANIEGVTTTDTVEGQVVTSGAAYTCPTGTYLFAYDGDYTGEVKQACFTNGTANKLGTENDPGTNITVSADYVEFDALNANLTFAVTGDDGLDDQEGTIYFSIYIVTTAGSNNLIESFPASLPDQNGIKILTSTGQLIGFIEAGNVQHSTYGSTLSPDTWYRVGYAWKVGGAGANHSISGVTLGSVHSWADDEDALDATAWTPDDFTIGENYGGNVVENTIRIKDVLVVPTFKGTDIWDLQ